MGKEHEPPCHWIYYLGGRLRYTASWNKIPNGATGIKEFHEGDIVFLVRESNYRALHSHKVPGFGVIFKKIPES